MKPLPALYALPLLLLLSACSPPPAAAPITRAVLVRTVGKDVGAPVMQVYTGEIRARFESDLAFRLGGKLIERKVDAGARVSRGQVLARLDPQDARLAASAATAQVAAAEADAALARAELARTETLLAKNFISASALDTRRTAMQAAAARLRQARAQAATAGNQTAYTELAADNDGIVTAVMAEAGQVVAAGQTVLRLARPGDREVLVHVPESRVQQLAPGAPAAVRLWLAPEQSRAGVVREVSPAADRATRTYAVRVSIADGDDLPLGATASIALGSVAPQQSVLPLNAVTRHNGQASVWLVDDAGAVAPHTVEIVAFREDGAVLRGTLAPGTRVVVAGVHQLVAGETVRPIEEGSAPALDVKR